MNPRKAARTFCRLRRVRHARSLASTQGVFRSRQKITSETSGSVCVTKRSCFDGRDLIKYDDVGSTAASSFMQEGLPLSQHGYSGEHRMTRLSSAVALSILGFCFAYGCASKEDSGDDDDDMPSTTSPSTTTT